MQWTRITPIASLLLPIWSLTLSTSASAESPKQLTRTPPELGLIPWERNLAKALSESSATGKPAMVLFDEVPGCGTCKQFGAGPLSHPLVVDASALFSCVAIYNNVPGEDERVLKKFKDKIMSSKVLEKLGLEEQKYFVVSSHREENINNPKNFEGLINSLNQIAEKYDYPIIVSTHPRTRNMLNSKNVKTHKNIQFLKPLGFSDYNALQYHSFAVLSDSGTISEESSILNFRALNIREAHERPEAMEEASVMMVGLNPERILQALVALEVQERNPNRNFSQVADYSMPNVSEKVVRIILSYVDYVNRVVWNK